MLADPLKIRERDPRLSPDLSPKLSGDIRRFAQKARKYRQQPTMGNDGKQPV